MEWGYEGEEEEKKHDKMEIEKPKEVHSPVKKKNEVNQEKDNKKIEKKEENSEY